MESAELERTTVDVAAAVGPRRLDLRATGQVVKFDGFLTLYREGRDDPEPAAGQAGEDDEEGRLPPMSAGDPLERRRIAVDAAFHRAAAALHGGEPRQAHGGARHRPALHLRGRSSPSLREREYVRIDKKRLVPEDKGLLVIAFLESFFRRYVEYDFTADLEEQLDRISNHEIDWKQVLRDFWRDFSAAIGETKELRTTEVLDALNELLGPHIFPPSGDGATRAPARPAATASSR